MKKYLLTATLLLLVGITASAYSFKTTNDGLCYDITGTSTVAVTFERNTDLNSSKASYENLGGDINIPETVYNGGKAYTVTAIKDYAFYLCNLLTGVSIPKTVKTIGVYAFWCSSRSHITSLTFAEGSELTEIGNWAFATTKITEVSIPNSVTTIGDYAFRFTLLETANIPTSLQTMGVGVFSSTNLKSIIIPSNLEEIPNYTFDGCKLLTNVVFPSTLKTIGQEAFRQTALTSVNFPNSLTTIGSYAFRSSQLATLTIPSSVTTIGAVAFCDTQLTSVTIPSTVTSLGNEAFASSKKLKTVNIQNSIISRYEFSNCNNLKEVNIGAGVESIDLYSLFGCSSLETLNINSAMATDINQYFKEIKPTLKTVKIGNAVTAIPENAFLDCAALEIITIPSTITSIGNSAFSGCTALREFYSLMDRPITIDPSVFQNVPVDGYCDLHVPVGSKVRYENKAVWKDFVIILEDAGTGGGGTSGVRGDVNGDGVVSAADISIIVNILAGLEQ